MAQARRAVRLRIEGRVQGVGFRAFVERQALARGLDGWVRNRRDGGVEAVASGPASEIDGLIARCREGPAASSVAMVKVIDENEGPEPSSGFSVQPTV
jgi:acylphosphatase